MMNKLSVHIKSIETNDAWVTKGSEDCHTDSGYQVQEANA